MDKALYALLSYSSYDFNLDSLCEVVDGDNYIPPLSGELRKGAEDVKGPSYERLRAGDWLQVGDWCLWDGSMFLPLVTHLC